ncbi:MAG: hypothetical protein AB1390_01745 [Nitrospirota bacterium]
MYRASAAFMCIMSFLFPICSYATVTVYDVVGLQGENVTLTAETRGKFLRKGGQIVEFFVNDKSVGRSLSGGDGVAYRKTVIPRNGIHTVEAKSGGDVGKGIILSLRKGQKIILIEIESGLMDDIFFRRPRKGSQNAVNKLSKRYPLVFLQSGLLSIEAARTWLGENGFQNFPILRWKEGLIFDEIMDKGFKIKAIIGSKGVIQSAEKYRLKTFSFEEAENAEEVRDWEEIIKKLR